MPTKDLVYLLRRSKPTRAHIILATRQGLDIVGGKWRMAAGHFLLEVKKQVSGLLLYLLGPRFCTF